jgi:hypothetical protein
VRFGLRPSVGFDVGALPGVAALGSLSFALMGRWWRAELIALAAGPRRASSSITPGAGGPVAMWAIGARGCGVPWVRRVEFPLCAGVEAGQQRGHGTGTTVAPRGGASPWVAIVLGSQVAWAPRLRRREGSPVALFFGVDLVVPAMRSSFSVGAEEVHRAARAGMRALAGVEVRVP